MPRQTDTYKLRSNFYIYEITKFDKVESLVTDQIAIMFMGYHNEIKMHIKSVNNERTRNKRERKAYRDIVTTKELESRIST